MKVYKNARLTPAGRDLLARRVEGGWTVRKAAAAAGISARIASKWMVRHHLGGERTHHDRSSAPRRCPHATARERIAQIEALRRQRMTGPRIAAELGIAPSTVGAILRRLGLGKLPALEPRQPENRFEREAPGELIHIAIKSLGKIDGVGHRITGDWRSRKRGIGWEHLHVAIDVASHLAYVEMLPTLGREDASGFLERALAWHVLRR